MHATPRSLPQPLDNVPERRFDDPTLARFARFLTTLYCECSRHIVDLLIGLSSFERYSAECANRGPEDAVLHQYLERVAGSARAMFEEALVRIARAEGIAIPGRQSENSLFSREDSPRCANPEQIRGKRAHS